MKLVLARRVRSLPSPAPCGWRFQRCPCGGDAQSGQETLTFKGHTGIFHSVVAFSPDGMQATGGSDAMVKVWNAQNGQKTLTLGGHPGDVHSVAFSPDGTRVAAASNTVTVWDVRSDQETLAN